MSKYFVVFKVLAAEHSRYGIGRLKKSLRKINLNILQWPCIRFLSFTLIFLSSSILCNQALLKVLLLLFNCSFSTGLVPDQFKVARVVPKKGSSFLVSNYRPISLLSIFNKVIEKLMYNRIISYLEKFSILHNNQFGFRSKHLTTHALLLLTNKIQRSINIGTYSFFFTFS